MGATGRGHISTTYELFEVVGFGVGSRVSPKNP